MIEDGALENVNAIFGFHLIDEYPLGTVAGKAGPIMAANGFFEAVISGKGGHAAIPQNTIDPIVAASNVIVSLQHLVSREADPLDSQVPCLLLSPTTLAHTHSLHLINQYVNTRAGCYGCQIRWRWSIQCDTRFSDNSRYLQGIF